MANIKYLKFKEKLLKASIDFDSADLRFALVSSAYTPVNTHEFLSSVSGILSRTAAAATGVTTTNGVLDCDDGIFLAVGAGTDGVYVVAFIHTGSDATASLVCSIDTADNLPVTPNGGNIPLVINAAGLLS